MIIEILAMTFVCFVAVGIMVCFFDLDASDGRWLMVVLWLVGLLVMQDNYNSSKAPVCHHQSDTTIISQSTIKSTIK